MHQLGRVMLACVLFATACVSDRVRLERGPLGPASYAVSLSLSGAAAVRPETVRATLRVIPTAEATLLRLRVGDDDPVEAGIKRLPGGRVVLDTVDGVSPQASGEANLASLVAQLDPPLPGRPVRLRESWTANRSLKTSTIQTSLRTRLQLRGFRRSGGADAVEFAGTVDGTLKTLGAGGIFTGRVTGRLEAVWALGAGRLVSSRTELTWHIPRLGRIVVTSSVRPA